MSSLSDPAGGRYDSVTLSTSDGESLEAHSRIIESPKAAVVIAHPNPVMGGDMYTPVPAALWAHCLDAQVNAVRFNFRGVGASSGSHDEGRAEQHDVVAAVDHLWRANPDIPIVASGWSFGADVSLAIDDERIAAWVLAAAPFKVFDATEMPAGRSDRSKLLVVPAHDHLCPPERAREVTADWINTEIVVAPETDHFFGGQLASVSAALDSVVSNVGSC